MLFLKQMILLHLLMEAKGSNLLFLTSAQNGDIYTVVLVTGGKDVGADSFVVGTPKDNNVYEPTTEGVDKQYGEPTTEDDVTGAVTIPDYPADKGTTNNHSG